MDFQAVSTGLQEFLERGGPVLVVIMATTFVMWAFILERFVFFLPGVVTERQGGARVGKTEVGEPECGNFNFTPVPSS